MNIKIERVWSKKLDDYKEVLDKYNATYYHNHAIINVEDVSVLFQLAKELGSNLIIDAYENYTISIYDSCIE